MAQFEVRICNYFAVLTEYIVTTRSRDWLFALVVRFIRACKPSTHVLMPPYIGAPREVARDNIINFGPFMTDFATIDKASSSVQCTQIPLNRLVSKLTTFDDQFIFLICVPDYTTDRELNDTTWVSIDSVHQVRLYKARSTIWWESSICKAYQKYCRFNKGHAPGAPSSVWATAYYIRTPWFIWI